MKWFRSNIRLGSRLALSALAIQLVLSFGHFHGSSADASPLLAWAASAHHGVSLAPKRGLYWAAPPSAAVLVRLKTRSMNEPTGHPQDGCAICAVMAMAYAMVAATPPCVPQPQTAEFSYSIADARFADLSSASIAFQPRGPPVV
jgi:hypothetical protein